MPTNTTIVTSNILVVIVMPMLVMILMILKMPLLVTTRHNYDSKA